MADEIRPARIHVPRRVRQVAREDREDNEEQFRKKLAEALDEGDEGPEGERDRRKGSENKAEAEPDDDTPLGHNIDLRT